MIEQYYIDCHSLNQTTSVKVMMSANKLISRSKDKINSKSAKFPNFSRRSGLIHTSYKNNFLHKANKQLLIRLLLAEQSDLGLFCLHMFSCLSNLVLVLEELNKPT